MSSLKFSSEIEVFNRDSKYQARLFLSRSRLATLRTWYRSQNSWIPKIRKLRKNTKSPSWIGPRECEKLTKKIQKRWFLGHFVFFAIFPEDAIHKKNKKGGCIPLFLGPLGPPPSLKKKEDRPQSILKKKGGPQKKKGDEHFCVFWKQQNAFWNFIFKMRRTFSKDHEHPKIPRPWLLSDLCRNFTLI